MIPLLVADDAKFLSIGLKSENIQHDLNQLFEWTALNKLPLNVEKCAHLAITNRQYQFYLGKEIIASADYQNDLGLTLSCVLIWNLHIDKDCQSNESFPHDKKKHIGFSVGCKVEPVLIYDCTNLDLRKSVLWNEHLYVLKTPICGRMFVSSHSFQLSSSSLNLVH